MKIFEIINGESHGEKEWVCAETNIQALKVYCNITGMDLIDFNESDEILEVPERLWDSQYIALDNDSEFDDDEFNEMGVRKMISFRTYMKHVTTPDIIAGTMYN